MKWLGIFFSGLVVSLAIFVGLIYFDVVSTPKFYLYSVCNTPIGYHIGKVDPEFGLSDDAFIERVKESAELWNEALGRKLLIYDTDSELDVNLSYDARTGLNSEIRELENELDAKKSSLDPSIAEYKRKLASYNEKVAKLNEEILYWNSRGGAPESEFGRLNKEQSELKQEAERLQQLASSLNQSTDNFNSQVGELNQKVNTFNSALEIRPEEGVYEPQTESITVYFNINQDELVHTLAHEFGHARGLDHIANEEAIMYPMTTETTLLTSEDINAMQFVCRERPWHEVFVERLQLLISLLAQRLSR